MENNFEERRKDIDLSHVDLDAHSFQRKKLELDEKYSKKAETEESFYTKERELANNNDDEIVRRTKVACIDRDYENSMIRLNEDYQKELKELEENNEQECYTKSQYFKWMYIGPVGKYSFPNEKTIHAGMSYFVKLEETQKLFVYYDAKFTNFIGEIQYLSEEWREV